MQRTLDGKVAVVTGSAMGFGRAIAVRLAREGADIVLVDLQAAEATEADVVKAGARAHVLECDVSTEDSVRRLQALIANDVKRCDILVNNVGVFSTRPFTETSFADWRRTMSTNLDSMFLVTKATVPTMIEGKWGRIINIASNTFGSGIPHHVDYIASKGGVIGFTRALASDLGVHGITVNAVAPGLTKTPGTQRPDFRPRGSTVDEASEHLIRAQAVKRAERVEDVAAAVSFLASEDAGFMSGQTMYVDGGLVRS